LEGVLRRSVIAGLEEEEYRTPSEMQEKGYGKLARKATKSHSPYSTEWLCPRLTQSQISIADPHFGHIQPKS
jgi:hypothetical protein